MAGALLLGVEDLVDGSEVVAEGREAVEVEGVEARHDARFHGEVAYA